ncbi:MAG: transporter permease [Thermomicrobiales bacterium]|jgi:peptide/nickel transport system permease protein|nr:transporter permease [Thermomicrobiales bacterium]
MAVAVTLPAFLIVHFVPADPVQAQLGDLASADPELVRVFRERWGLDRPIWDQYVIFLNGLVHGNLGESIATRRPVLDDIRDYAPATFELATAAAMLTVLVGLPLGVLAAIKRDSWIDHLARFVSLIGLSTPTFWLAFIALAVFYGGLRIAPGPGQLDPGAIPPPRVTGLMLVDSLLIGDLETFRSALAHLILPASVLAATTIGLVTRTTRASMLEALQQDYVRVAHAKGLRVRVVVLRHALRNALIPVLTLGGLAYAQLLSGTVLTETIFSWPGLGRYAFESAVAVDFPAILGITLVVALIYLLVNFLVDMSYAIIDPRVANR